MGSGDLLREPFVAAFRSMALIALHRLYQRTCKTCGYRWTVTRAQKQSAVRAPWLQPGPQRLSSSMASEEAFVEAQEEQIQPLRECAKCGSVEISERPITKRHPADPPN
jgi:predicted nucleic-acid-binding Zn-ribbon protein